jgi:hypothetical protein
MKVLLTKQAKVIQTVRESALCDDGLPPHWKQIVDDLCELATGYAEWIAHEKSKTRRN